MILLNRNNYFGTYSLDFNRDIIKFVLENHDSEQIVKWGSLAKEHVKNNFSLDKMLNELESYFYSQYAQAHR